MKLIVGLGNPGRKYLATRHNVGFDVLDRLADRHGLSHGKAARAKSKFDAVLVEAQIETEPALLLWPQTYMNLSGRSVGRAVDFYKCELSDLLVVCDDFNLPLARLRLRAKGSAGGQKGLADIIRHLGSDEFPRLRLGVGPLPDGWDAADFVLSKFKKSEQHEIDEALAHSTDAVADWVRHGIEHCMNTYN